MFHARFKWERGNSGIQFRSQISESSIAGYQADVDLSSDSITGSLYDVGGRGFMAQAPDTLMSELPKDE